MTHNNFSTLAKNIRNALNQNGFLQYDVFRAVSATAILTAIEVICLTPDGQNVLLVKREKTDPDWPSLWHSPGIILCRGDKSFEHAFSRVAKETNAIFLQKPIFLKAMITDTKSERGIQNALVHMTYINASSISKGTLFPVHQLPLDIIPFHKDYIAIAASSLQKQPKISVPLMQSYLVDL